MTREEYLAGAKQRARDLLAAGKLDHAFTSMLDDIKELDGGVNAYLEMACAMSVAKGDRAGVSRFIEGFN